MAEKEEEASAGSWWGGWLQAAKDTSASALEFVKHDLSEFTCTVQNDTNQVAGSIKNTLTQENAASTSDKVKAGVSHGMSTLWGGLSKALIIEAEDKDDPGIPIHVFSRAKARLHALQLEPATYSCEVSSSPEHYQQWVEEFNLERRRGDISELLVTNAEMRSIYTRLVPSSVSHVDFWSRYFYKVTQLEADEARREEFKKRVDNTSTEDIIWDDDDDDWCDVGGPPSPLADVQNPSSPPADVQGHPSPLADVQGHPSPPADVQGHPSPPADVQGHPSPPADVQGHPSPPACGTADNMEAAMALSSQAQAELNEQQYSTNTEVSPDNAPASTQESNSSSHPSTSELTTGQCDSPTLQNDTIIHTNTDSPGITIPSQPTQPNSKIDIPEDTALSTSQSTSPQRPGSSTSGKLSQTALSVSASNDSDLSSGVVIVTSAETSPPSDITKGGVEDWEEDFDIDLTDEDIKLAQEQASKAEAEDTSCKDDWESWE